MSYTEFGLRIRCVLLERKMTMKQLAEECGISLSYLSDILKGARTPEKQIKRIKEILEI